MPLKLELLTSKGTEWIGLCKHRLHMMSVMRKPGAILKQTYYLPKGVMAQVISSDVCDIIRIWGGGLTGIICHPRSKDQATLYVIPAALPGQEAISVIAIVGGWHTDKDGNFVELTSNFDYPLVDSDNASFLFSGEDSVKSGGFLGSEGNYGNIYWHNNDKSNLSVISYKGIPTRHFMLDQQGAINGADFATDGQGICLYKSGIFLTYTRKGQDGKNEVVNGAAELEGEVICCTPSGVSILQGSKWVDIPIIGWVASPAWYFDSTGKKAINSEGTRILTFQKADNGSVTGVQTANYVPATNKYLYLTSSGQTGYSSLEYNSDKISQDSCFELKANGDIVNLSVIASLTAKSEYKSSASKSFADYAIYDDGKKYIVTLTYDGNVTVCAGLANLDGSPASFPPGVACGPFTYSFTGATQIGNTSCAKLDPTSACCPNAVVMNVSATITGPGVDATGSRDITTVAKAGSWVMTSCNLEWVTYDIGAAPPCGCTSLTDTTDNAYYMAHGLPSYSAALDPVYSPCGGTKTQEFTRSGSYVRDIIGGGLPVAHSGCNPPFNFVSIGTDVIGGGCALVFGGEGDPCGMPGEYYCIQNVNEYGAQYSIGTVTYTWVCP